MKNCMFVRVDGVVKERPAVLFYEAMIWFSLLLVFVVIASPFLNAEEKMGVIRIQTENPDGAPVVGVKITLTGFSLKTPRKCVTGANGQCVFSRLNPGIYRLKAVLDGYMDKTVQNIRVKAGKTAHFKVKLEYNPETRDMVEYSGVEGGVDGGVVGGVLGAPPDVMGYSAAPASAAIHSAPPPTYPFNTRESVNHGENNFKKSAMEPLSTFSIDVDTASYSFIRRLLREERQLPGPGAVRIEEILNYFSYSYVPPDWKKSKIPFSIATETGPCPWAKEHLLARIGIQGIKKPKSELPPSNLVFLLDVSGSMDQNDKLPLLLDCFRLLTMELDQRDKVSIVVYAGSSGLVLPPTAGNEKEKILEVLSRLRAGGSTAGGAGIKLAYDTACAELIPNGNNRVILATDGDFNVGVSSTDELVRLIEEKRKTGVFLTVLGFGMDNLKDSRMEQLADKGNGNYFYIDSLREGKKVMSNGLLGNMYTIAKDVKIQVEFNPAYVTEYRLIGYENRKLETEDFENDQKDAGELGPGHSVTALYELIPARKYSSAQNPGLKYTHITVTKKAFAGKELMTVKLRYKLPEEEKSRLIEAAVKAGKHDEASCSDDFRFAAAAAEWGLLLEESQFKGEAGYDHLLESLKKIKGVEDNEQRREFAELVRLSQQISSDRKSQQASSLEK